MLCLPIQTIGVIGVIHSIPDISNQFLDFPLVRWPHATHRPVTSGNGDIAVAAFGNGEIFFSGARRQE
jgi:hypothetical protein